MKEMDKAALSEIEKILNSGDPQALEALKAMISAADQAKALDEAGVQRKDAAAPVAEVAAAEATEAEVDKKAKPFKPEDEKPPEPDAEDEDGEEEEEPKKPAKKRGKAKAAAVEQPAPVVADDVSDNVLKGITAYVDTSVASRVEEQTKTINTALEALVDNLSALVDQVEALEKRDKGLAATNEMQRGVFERMKQLSASLSETTVIDKDDPLATKKLAPATDDPLGMFRK